MATSFTASEHQMNLSVLQNKDPFIKSIEDSASQVAAYSFNSLTNEWEKTNIEGTLFVYTRSAAPTNGFTIMNRLHPTDLVEPINKNLEFQLQDPFLLYRNSKSAIFGIWFYDREECARIGRLMNSLVQVASGEKVEERRVSEGESEPSTQAVDILQMLSKAQDEYDKTKQAEVKKHPAHDTAPLKDDKSGASELKHPTATHISLDILFKKAQQNNNSQSLEQKLICGGTNSAFRLPPPTLHKQPTPTVEQIEREGRIDLGHESPNTTLKRTLNIAPISTHPHVTTTATFSSPKPKISDKKAPKTTVTSSSTSDPPTTNFLVQALFSQQKQQQSKHHSPILTSTVPHDASKTLPLASLNAASHNLPQHPSPTPPTPPTTIPSPNSHQNLNETYLPPWLESEKSASNLLSPLVFQSNSKIQQKTKGCVKGGKVQEEEEEDKCNPLSKEQLKQALITLIKTDSSFLTAVHKAYVDALNREIGRKQ